MTVARLPLHEVAAASEWVVLALVRSLSGEGRDRRARAEVLEAWKGTPPAEVEFSACPSWMCDISGAEPGETAVFFLAADGSGPHRIAHAGRGRMPVRTVGAERYATIWDDVVLPPGTAMVDGPDPEYPFIRSVALKDLKGLVLRTAAAKDAPPKTDPVRRPTEGERFIAAHGPAKVHFSLFVGAFLLAVLLVYSGQLAGSSDWRTWLGFAFSVLWAVLMGLAVGRLAAYVILHPLYWTASRDNGPFFRGARVLILHGPHRNKPGTVVGAVGQHEGQWAVRVLEGGEEGPEVELPGFQLLRTDWVPDKTPLFRRRPPARPRAP